MRAIASKGWLLAAAMLFVASAGALTLLTSEAVFHSAFRGPLSDFVQPGVTVWWFVLGGPFRDAPSSFTGIGFAAFANAVLWLLLLWVAAALARFLRRALAPDR